MVAVEAIDATETAEEALLDRVFAALADPVRRAVLTRLDGEDLLVSELAAPFDISLQPVPARCRADLRGRAVAQPLQQVLAVAVRHACRVARSHFFSERGGRRCPI